MRSASPRWLPSKRRGRTTLRMKKRDATPISASTQNTLASASYQAQCGAASCVDDRDHRERDRREEHDEGPEDEGVHQARDEPLQQLALAEHDDRLLAQAVGHVVAALDAGRLAHPDEPRQQQHAAGEEDAGDGDGGGQREAGDHPLTRRSSAVIAGTISSTSPITA